MSVDRHKPSVEPVFFDGPAGRLFAVYYRPAGDRDGGADLIHVPAFAEEMNRARRMVALQGRSLAAQGVGVLVLDLYGTGDSAGDFSEARWALWRADVQAAAQWLEERGRRLAGLWGLRLGGLLAAEVAAAHPGRFPRLLLWQPVTDGKAMLTQFLRIRVAAAMAGEGKDTTGALRIELAEGHAIEIGGYELAPELAAAIDGAQLQACEPTDGHIDWLDVGEVGAALAPGRQRLVETWRNKGIEVSTASVAGDPFWSIQEVTLAPDLLVATQRCFAT